MQSLSLGSICQCSICRGWRLLDLENISARNIRYKRVTSCSDSMKRTLLITATLLVALSIASFITPFHVNVARASPYVDPLLTRNASTSPANSKAEVIIVLDHIPTSADAQAVMRFSRIDAPMTQLPMILAVSNYGNLTNLSNYPGVISLWANRQLTYLAQVQTTTHTSGEVPVLHSWWNNIMHVPDAWSRGFQGQGIGVALIDTGVDAGNPSLGYSFTPTTTSPKSTLPCDTERQSLHYRRDSIEPASRT